MKAVIGALIFSLFSGCAGITHVEKCIGYGFKEGSPELTDCTMKESQLSRQLQADRWNAYASRMKGNHGHASTCNTRTDYLRGGVTTTCN